MTRVVSILATLILAAGLTLFPTPAEATSTLKCDVHARVGSSVDVCTLAAWHRQGDGDVTYSYLLFNGTDCDNFESDGWAIHIDYLRVKNGQGVIIWGVNNISLFDEGGCQWSTAFDNQPSGELVTGVHNTVVSAKYDARINNGDDKYDEVINMDVG